jgi:hypothetical protein
METVQSKYISFLRFYGMLTYIETPKDYEFYI